MEDLEQNLFEIVLTAYYNIQSNLYIKATKGKLKMWSL